jgi:hypothetical protein
VRVDAQSFLVSSTSGAGRAVSKLLLTLVGLPQQLIWMLEACSVSDVINFRLGLVITPRRVLAQK